MKINFLIVFMLFIGISNFFIQYNFQIELTSINSISNKNIFKIDEQISFTSHGPIIINSDNDFTILGFPGSGTFSDPYKIEGLNITSSELYVRLIQIFDVNAYFTIGRNYLMG